MARSYGDLRENFEFKAAKEMQAVLMRRKSELEAALHLARGTDFENPDTTQVSIGTVVTLRESGSGREQTYTILGAWDGDPERHIISYQTAIGQALLSHKVGEMVTLNKDEGSAHSGVSISPALSTRLHPKRAGVVAVPSEDTVTVWQPGSDSVEREIGHATSCRQHLRMKL